MFYTTRYGNTLPIYKDKYYVYALMKPNGEIFYIGKGKGDRINSHFRSSNLNFNSPKVQIIKKYGDKIRREILCYFDDEEKAYSYEESLIAHYGVKSQEGTLTNYALDRYNFIPEQKENARLGHKSRKDKFSKETILRVYKLYFQESLDINKVSEQTGLEINYLYAVLKGTKHKSSYNQYISSGVIENNREYDRHYYIQPKSSVYPSFIPTIEPRVNKEDAQLIIDLYDTGNYSFREIGEAFNLSCSRIGDIVNNGLKSYPDLVLKPYKKRKNFSLSEEDVINIKNDKKQGLSVKEILLKYNLSKSNFYRLLNGTLKYLEGFDPDTGNMDS